jgi:hypothetical protein
MPSGGRDFLRLMNDQSRRAADFDRRMRWTWMRRELTDRAAVDAEPEKADDVVDLTTTAERAEPLLPD